MPTKHLFLLISICYFISCKQETTSPLPVAEKWRPAYHFTPDSMWMNDPNGLVYTDGIYHLFYQFYPDSNVWGPMHWGHATSTDLVSWEHQPIALYPDSLGYIFSGSAVVDTGNTAGFGKNAMVAMFTHHNDKMEMAGSNVFQYQSLAYSTDGGKTFTKYAGNPVVKNPGIRDFRDPKVSWYAPGQHWVMVLAAYDRAKFYTSADLKNWTESGEFGLPGDERLWECPRPGAT
ncbi:MAG: glycoside hydrolase family 32 protein [Saprospiraceae bacterium]|nr:glycoside hydrolase family 32 protein [Saprospiraceae bacterium]